MKTSSPSIRKRIYLLGIFCCLLAVLLFYKEYHMLLFVLEDIGNLWDVSATLYFVPLLVLVAAIIPFLLRKKAGWLLLTIYLTYCTVFSIGLLYESVIWQPSCIPLIAYLFVQNYTPIICLFSIAFFGSILWIITRREIRSCYNIHKKNMLLLTGFVSLLTALIFWFTRHIYLI